MDTKISSFTNGHVQLANTKAKAPASAALESARVPTQQGSLEKPADKTELPPVARLNQAVDDAEQKPPLERAIDNLNRHVQKTSRALVFTIDERYGKPVVSVVDKETEQVIRQIPSEFALQIADALDDTTGILVSEHA